MFVMKSWHVLYIFLVKKIVIYCTWKLYLLQILVLNLNNVFFCCSFIK